MLDLLFTADYMPHGHCFLWQPALIWLHAVSDSIVAFSYAVIPMFLIKLVRLRRDLAFNWMFVLFALFILSCGATHVLGVLAIWRPYYWLEGTVKGITAVASLGTAFLLWPLLPRALALPGPEAFAEANRRLAEQAEHQRAIASFTQLALLRTNLNELSKEATALVARTLRVDRATIFTFDASSRTMRRKSSFGWPESEVADRVIHVDDYPFARAAIESQHPFTYRQLIETHKLDVPADFARNEVADGLTSVIYGQLEPFGLLSAQSRQPRLFTNEELEFIQAVANVIGIACERQRSEAAVKELVRSNTELEQFTYVASHDLQEPLRKITSFCQLLAEEYGERLDKDGNEYLSFVIDGVRRMQNLIDDVLELSRVGIGDVSKEPVDLATSWEVALANLEIPIASSSAKVMAVTPLPTLRVHAPDMIRLFQNLVGNAIKYRSSEPPEVLLACQQRDHEWLFSIKDNGIGIEPKFLEKIFVIFRRLHGRSKYPGTGIGLAICKKIVEHHGGRIWAESDGRNGTTFYFTVPIL